MACASDPEERQRQFRVSLSDFNDAPCSPQQKPIPWDNFSSWISCFCIVTFDIELGQVIEKLYPENYFLTDVEKANICYLAFPDSNTGCMGDTQFHFRIRSSYVPTSLAISTLDQSLQKDFHHYTGYVLFRQVKDATIKRGYFQKSLVLLTRLPYVNLFRYLVRTIAPEYFVNGEIALETVCYQIDKWMTPYPGRTLQLPVMGNVLQISIPIHKSGVKATKFIEKPILPKSLEFICSYESQLYSCFGSMIQHLHLLWELVLLGEPIVIMAPSPTVSSEGVQSLVNLIKPLQYTCDYRPYFTIHDSELKEYTTKTQAPPKVILGVTNPFFAKTLQLWPHIIRIGDMPSLTIMKNGTGRKSQDLKPGIYTKYKPCLNDKAFFKKIVKGANGTKAAEVQNNIINKYIIELTQSFVIPLERYIGSLMPLQRSISPWRSPPKLRQFNAEEFLQTLPGYGPQLTSNLKGNWQTLYQKFFKSPNFEAWFEKKKFEVNRKLDVLHLEALCKADINQWTKERNEVEIVDLYMQLKNKLIKCRNPQLQISNEIRHLMHLQIDNVLKTLPLDLQNVLRKSG